MIKNRKKKKELEEAARRRERRIRLAQQMGFLPEEGEDSSSDEEGPAQQHEGGFEVPEDMLGSCEPAVQEPSPAGSPPRLYGGNTDDVPSPEPADEQGGARGSTIQDQFEAFRLLEQLGDVMAAPPPRPSDSEGYSSSSSSAGFASYRNRTSQDAASLSNETDLPSYNQPPTILQEKADSLADRLVAIRARHRVSDRAIEEVFQVYWHVVLWYYCSITVCITCLIQVLLQSAEDVVELRKAGILSGTYRHKVRHLAVKKIPAIHCSALIESVEEGIAKVIKLRPAQQLPKLVAQPPAGVYVLRTEAFMHLKDIVRHYKRTHSALGIPAHYQRHNLQHAILSADGVRCGKSGGRNLQVVSIMIGGDIYPWAVYCPVKAADNPCEMAEAKPNVDELLRYTSILLTKVNQWYDGFITIPVTEWSSASSTTIQK